MALLSRSEADFIRLGCQDDCRIDGRRCLETRDFVIVTEKGYYSSASTTRNNSVSPSNNASPPFILCNGSARLTTCDLQETILCSVKAQVVRPASNKPDRGIVELFVERLTTGSQSELDEIQALLSHLLLQDDGVLVNRKELCILPHEYVWKLSIDLVFLTSVSSASSRLHAVSSVIRAALESTLLPLVATQANANPTSSANQQYSLVVQDDIEQAQPLLTEDGPTTVIVTVTLIPYSSVSKLTEQQSVVMIIDATSQEQACASGLVHVTIQIVSNDDIRICAVHATGTIPVVSLPEIIDTAVQVAKLDGATKRVYKEMSGLNSLLQEPFGIQ